MFIETMSSTELLHEYQADLNEIQDRTIAYDGSEYVRNYLWKRRRQQRVVISKPIVTARGNRYLGVLIYTQNGFGTTKKWLWESYHVGFMNTSRGMMVLAFFAEKKMAVKYTTHFFQRYKSRMLEVCDWKTKGALLSADTNEKIVATYIQRNLGSSWIETQSVYKDKTHVFAPVPDGVALMQWDDKRKTMQANTFVTYKMLDEKQNGMIERLVEFSKLSNEEQKKVKDFLFEVRK